MTCGHPLAPLPRGCPQYFFYICYMKTTPVLNILFLKPLRFILLVVLLVVCGKGYGQIITTFAGGGSGGDGGPAAAASIYDPTVIIFDKHDNVYITESVGHDIRKVSPTGIITTYAGTNGTAGYGGDGGAATAAMLNEPVGIVCDSIGNLLICDALNNRVRKVDVATGIISTVLGNGTMTDLGDGGPATAATMHYPSGIIFDKAGNLYVSSAWYIRKINKYGIISTIAGIGISGNTGDGGPATSAKVNIGCMCFDDADNLIFTDVGFSVIRKISPAGIISHVAGVTGTYIFNGDGIPASNAHFDPYGIAFGPDGNLYFSDLNNNRIRVIDRSGIIHTVAGTGAVGISGDGGRADTAEIDRPDGLVFDSCGNLYFTQIDNPRVRKVTYPHCGYLSVEESKSRTSDIRFYPNPVADMLFIEGGVPLESVVLTDLLGKVVYRQDGVRAGTLLVSMGNLPCGIYVLEVMNSEGVREVRRVVKE